MQNVIESPPPALPADVVVPRIECDGPPSVGTEKIAAAGNEVRRGHERSKDCVEEVNRLLARRNSSISVERDYTCELIIGTAVSIYALGLKDIGTHEVVAKAGDVDGSEDVFCVIRSSEGNNINLLIVSSKARWGREVCRASPVVVQG